MTVQVDQLEVVPNAPVAQSRGSGGGGSSGGGGGEAAGASETEMIQLLRREMARMARLWAD